MGDCESIGGDTNIKQTIAHNGLQGILSCTPDTIRTLFPAEVVELLDQAIRLNEGGAGIA